ncbi:hypothetical protein J2Z76_002732 [Sedimentibacter acidaminivorans]|uniref:Phage-Barnase-EndoU-ColicinE5/D-RelE like nuclease 3 domain-containing protein n=1 Tax=Sedimentibacter acidaminivorans TaxID=913099 RepID=A0ABS4GH39_9FIRM|nr:hypothetical protein [Sedimentibacter acidaminivorans]MBP1926862.1 hypothetical protein [Sedimentibacter acidaminivorans]
MSEKFDIDNVVENVYELGLLKLSIIELLGIEAQESKILISKDKITYTKKHCKDYSCYDEFKLHTEAAPEIIESPDYVGIHPKGDSIVFIKEISKNVLVAVRLSNTDKKWVKTIYPITDAKLNNYIRSGRLKKVDK